MRASDGAADAGALVTAVGLVVIMIVSNYVMEFSERRNLLQLRSLGH